MEPWGPQSGLLDLPAAVWAQILASVASKDIVALSTTCRELTHLTADDALWQRQCEAWLAAARSPSNGLAALTAPALRGALRLPSYHCLYKALHQLGSWPAGIWYATNDSALPCGRLLVAQLHPPSGTLRLQPPRHHVLNGPAPAADAWELRPGWCIRAEAGEGGIWVGVEAIDNATGALHCAMQLSLDGRSLIMHRSQQRRRPPPAAGHRTLLPAAPEGSGGASGSGGATGSGSGSGGSNSVPSSSAGQALASLAAYLGLHNARLLLESISYCRVQLPAPADLEAVAGEPPGMALLRRHQGIRTGSYGPHGMEVLQLTASSCEADAPPGCPITGPRLQAVKLLGDPNVPALKYSFVVDAASCRLGPYDRETDDPFAPGPGAARPCLAFFQAATLVMDVEARPVVARFRAVGQINAVPGQWNPEWVPATVLLYGPPLERLLTVIFEDEEFPFVSKGFVSEEAE